MGEFLDTMAGAQAAKFKLMTETFDFSRYQVVSDVGGALALLSPIVNSYHKHLAFTTFDLLEATALAEEHVNAAGMGDASRWLPGIISRTSCRRRASLR